MMEVQVRVLGVKGVVLGVVDVAQAAAHLDGAPFRARVGAGPALGDELVHGAV